MAQQEPFQCTGENIMEFILIIIATGLWGGWLGRRKGYQWTGWWLGFLLGLIGVAIVHWGLKDQSVAPKTLPGARQAPRVNPAPMDPDEAALAKEVRLAKLRNEQHHLDREFYADDPTPTESSLAMPPMGFRPDA
jgi:hypothetical protein